MHSEAILLPLEILKKFKTFFRKTINFFKKTQILNVLRIFTISVAFYEKFATCSNFRKNSNFFSKNPSILFKKPNFERFEKSYCFSRILRQLCYNWMKKIHLNNRCWLFYASSIGKHRVKKRTYLRVRFCFHIPKNMAQNNKAERERSGQGWSRWNRADPETIKCFSSNFL